MQDKLTANITEHEMVDGLKNGHQKVFEIVYDKYVPLILTILGYLDINDTKSEEVLIKLFTRIKYEANDLDLNKMRLFAWILTLTRQTIEINCAKELEQYQIQNESKYVNNKSALLNSSQPLLNFLITNSGGIKELSLLTGITKEELMILIKKEINLLKK